jgi:hypothetical protein
LGAWKLGDGASISGDQAYDGQFALKLTNSSTATTQVLDLKPHTHYRLSARVKNDEALSGSVTFDTNDVFDQELGIQKFTIKPGEASQWTTLSGIFYSDVRTKLRLRIFSADLVGIVYFDDVVLVPTSFPTYVAYQDEPFIYTVGQKGEDGQLWVHEAVSLPRWMQFDAAEKTLRGTPGFDDVGTHAVTFSHTNGVEDYVETFVVRVFGTWNPLREWQQIHGVLDLTGDPDNDGFVNLLEFALGGDPGKEDRLEVAPSFAIGESSMAFGFRRNQLSGNYVIQESSNLVDWSDVVFLNRMDGWMGGG